MYCTFHRTLGTQKSLLVSLRSLRKKPRKKSKKNPPPNFRPNDPHPDFCNQIGEHEAKLRPVLTLTENGETSGHAVVLKSYERSEEYLDLVTIDSLSETGETSVECSIFDDGEKEILALGEFPDQWCLSSEKCYYFHFN